MGEISRTSAVANPGVRRPVPAALALLSSLIFGSLMFAHALASAQEAGAPSPSPAAAEAAPSPAGESIRKPAPGLSGASASASPEAASRGEGQSAGGAPAKSAAPSANSPLAGFGLSSSNGPIDIKSETLSLDYKGKTVLFNGNVRAVQTGSQLTSDTLKVLYGNDFKDVQQVIADGHVKITQGDRLATCDHAVLDQVARTVEMTGNPVIHEGPDQVTGNRILIHLDTQKSVVEGAPRAVIFPRKQETRDNGESDHRNTAEQDRD